MNNTQKKHFESLYAQHLNALARLGKSEKTIESYSRAVRRISEFFDKCPDELTALINRALLAIMYNTGARVSEIAQVRRCDLQLTPAGRVLLHGKGRKERMIPLWKQTVRLLKFWLAEIAPEPLAPVFPNRYAMPITRSGIETRLKAAVCTATVRCPSLRKRHVSPHVIRHTTAMHLLESGVDLTVVALWLGHESIETTH